MTLDGGPPEDNPIGSGRLDLWYVDAEAAAEAHMLEVYRRWLPPDEVARADKFRVEKDRTLALVSRAMVRTALSYYSGIDPLAWRFRTNSFGKPSIAEPVAAQLEQPLRFNVSHTKGMAVCAIVAGEQLDTDDVGVDVEDLQRRRVRPELARRFFADSEAEALEALPSDRRCEAFLEFWTLKEAYIKARGMGLAIPLADFAFTLSADRPPAIRFAKTHRQCPEDWQFAQLRLAGRYQIAVALQYPATKRLTICLRETIPLHQQGDPQILPQNTANRWNVDTE